MLWNWQQKDWPHFSYESRNFEQLEASFLQNTYLFIGSFSCLKKDDKNQVKIDLISREAIKTSEIEGEYLNRDSVQSSIRHQFRLDTSRPITTAAEQGIAEMMVSLYENSQDALTHELLFTWHQMLCKGRRDLLGIGKYREHSEPMQVVSGALHQPNIHFEAPPSHQVIAEMDRFIGWFNESQGKTPALIRAAIAHLFFVCIHPFEDGNGRIARALSEKALAQEVGQPTLLAISYTIEKQKKAYYDALENANKCNEITDWIVYFAGTILAAQQNTQKWLEFVIQKTRFFDSFSNELNNRQEKMCLRVFEEGIDGFSGGISAANYQRITKASTATASRDLRDLVNKGIVTSTGQLKSTRYYLNLDG